MCGASKEQKAAYANEAKVSSMLTSIAQNFAGSIRHAYEHKDHLTPIQKLARSFGLSQLRKQRNVHRLRKIFQRLAHRLQRVRGAVAFVRRTTYLPSGSEASIIGSLAQDTR